MATHYEMLGLPQNSTPDELKRSYLSLIFGLHPDRNGGDSSKTEKFMQVQAAYDVLSDPVKRADYDRTINTTGKHWNDMFNRFHTKPRTTYVVNGSDIELEVIISLAESYSGCEKDLSYDVEDPCPVCDGSKYDPDVPKAKCHVCGGGGMKYDFVKKTVAPCTVCEGRGKIHVAYCSLCNGAGVKRRPVQKTVAIPESIKDGATIKYAGLGSPGVNHGDLLLTVRVAVLEDAIRSKNDLCFSVLVPLPKMITGGLHTVKSPVGTSHEIEIYPGTQSGEIKIVKGTGFLQSQSSVRGDMRVRLMAEVPAFANDHERRRFAEFLANPQ